MPRYRLHYFPESGNSYKIALMLTLCGQPWEPAWTNFLGGQTRSPEWRATVNEMGEIPVLEDEGTRLTQTGAILLRLGDRHSRFGGEDEAERFQVLRWLLWDNHKLTGYMATYRFMRAFTPDPNPEVLAFFRGRLDSILAIAERHFERIPFAASQRPTVADLSMSAYLSYPAEEIGYDLPTTHPAIRRMAWPDHRAAGLACTLRPPTGTALQGNCLRPAMLFTVASKKGISLMFLVRHGETRSNVEHRYHGQLDSPLTQRGIAQAHAIGRHLATVLGARSVEIVSSPQPRALRTAELIRHHLSGVESLRTDDRLCEVSIGDWEGLNHDEIIALAAGVFDGDGRWEWCFQAPGGETYEAFAGRVGEFLCDINSAQSQSLIVASHGILSRVLRGLYAGLPRLLALTRPIPQDRIYRLLGGNIEVIKVHGDLRAPRILRAQPLPGLRLFVEFDDGVSGPAEIIDFIDTESAQRLRDETLYRQVLIDDFGAVRWITGGVLAPDALYEQLRKSPNSRIKSCF